MSDFTTSSVMDRRRWLSSAAVILVSSLTGCRSASASEPIWVGHLRRSAHEEATVLGIQQTLFDLQEADYRVGGRVLGVRHVVTTNRDQARAEAARLLGINRVLCLLIDPEVDGTADIVASGRGHEAAVFALGDLDDRSLCGQAVFLGTDAVLRGEKLARYAATNKRKRVTTPGIPANDANSALVEAFYRQFRELGGEVMPNLTPQEIVARHNAARGDLPDVILLGKTMQGKKPPDSWKNLIATGIPITGDLPRMLPSEYESLSRQGELWVTGILPGENELPEAGSEWFARYQKRFGKPPTAEAVLAHDGMSLVAEVLRGTNRDDRKLFAEEIEKRESFDGLSGMIRWEGGRPDRSLYLTRYARGKQIAPVVLPSM